MAQIIDMNKFSFHGDELKAIGEMIFDDVINAPEIDLLHTVFTNIVTDKEIGFIGEGGLVGKANSGCDPTTQNFTIATRVLKWSPIDWEILIHACWKDLKTTAAVYSLKTGTAIADFTNTDYINVVTTVLATAMKEFVLRFAWFNDVDAENVSDAATASRPNSFNMQTQVLPFMQTVTSKYEEMPEVFRYAWFTSTSATMYGLSSSMLTNPDLSLTPLGEYYKTVSPRGNDN
ncbi:hypothetical protein FACS1894156_7550 [Bacteroidia bacterium]|nr:hypothetical protein FACS1894156_7550 [Bacteroidia bacterium]